MNRRELLKLFGVGATIAPVVGGVALATDHARLVEIPKVEIAEPPKLRPVTAMDMLVTREKLEVTIFARSPIAGTVLRLDCSAFVAECKYDSHFMSMPYGDQYDPGLRQEVHFVATGPVRMVDNR